jgi:hypothetical protein
VALGTKNELSEQNEHTVRLLIIEDFVKSADIYR